MAESSTAFDPLAVRAVAFDGYGTLFDFEHARFRTAIATILAEQRIETDSDAFFLAWDGHYSRASVWGDEGVNREHPSRPSVLDGPLPDWHSQWEIWRRQFQWAFERTGIEGNPEHGANHLRALLAEADPYPDAHDTIEALAGRGYLLGLLSNADEDFLQGALSRGRLRFSVIQSSESLRAYKPNRAVYLALCHRLGCEAGEVLYVGDSAIADVSGAGNAGLGTAWLRRGPRPFYPEALPPPDVTLDSLTELLALLPGPRQRPTEAS